MAVWWHARSCCGHWSTVDSTASAARPKIVVESPPPSCYSRSPPRSAKNLVGGVSDADFALHPNVLWCATRHRRRRRLPHWFYQANPVNHKACKNHEIRVVNYQTYAPPPIQKRLLFQAILDMGSRKSPGILQQKIDFLYNRALQN